MVLLPACKMVRVKKVRVTIAVSLLLHQVFNEHKLQVLEYREGVRGGI